MKLLLDFFPIALFFIAFKLFGIYTATGVAIVASFLQIGYLRWRTGRVDVMQWVSLALITVFGGATLISHNETFIKIKPSVLYGLMGLTLVISQWIFKKNLLQTLMGAHIQLPKKIWHLLTWSWVIFFFLMSVLNFWVAFSFNTDIWVSFKLFGSLGLTLVFVAVQALYLSRFVGSEG